MSKMVLRMFALSVLMLLLSTGLVTGAFAQSATPLAPNSIQASRVQYDGNTGTYVTNFYVSPYSFPEIFNDPAGLTTGNEIQDIAGIQGSIYIDQFSTVPAAPAAGTLSLPSNGPPAAYPTVEPGAYITTSFSSKSEGALMLSLDGTALTYMGYQGADQLDDVSNSYSANPNYQLSPNSYTADPNTGTPISITAASDTSHGNATLTLSSSVNVPSGAYFTIAGMSTNGYNGTFATNAASTSNTIVLTGLPDSLASCSSVSIPCGGTATYDPPYPFYDREVALIDASGLVNLTPIDNINSGDNPRAALTVDENEFYIVGNSDSTTASPSTGPNNPGLTIGARCGAPLNNISYQLGTYTAADRPDESAKKHFKDNNWRGVGIYTDVNGHQQLVVSKGSGSNGDDGLFQVGTALPTCSSASISSFGENGNGGAAITELFGAQATVPNGASYQTSPYLPFGFWFANATTLYVADEGNSPSYTGGASPSFSNSTNGTFTLPQLANGSNAADPYAGLEKWSLVNGSWQLDYTIQAGLNLYQPTTVNGYNDVNGDPIQSYPYGIRNISGYNNGDGTVTIYAVTAQFSSVSGGESDPTSIVGITDQISATSLPNEQFVTLQTSAPGEVYRGVAYVPPASRYTRQTQTVDFQSVGSVTYGQGPITLSATATSNWPIFYAVVSGPATVSGNTLTLTGQGSVTVSATQTGNTDYSSATASQTFTVAGEANTVTFTTPAPASAEYGSTFTVAASGLGSGAITYTSDGVVCTNSGATYTMISGTGTCTVTTTQAADNYYASASGSEYVTAQPAQGEVSVSLTSGSNPSTYGQSITFTATVTSDTGAVKGRRTTKRPKDLNGSVSWSANTGCSASGVSGNPPQTATCTTSILAGGTDTVTATYTANDSNHTTASGSVSQKISKASQTITVTTPAPSTAIDGGSFTIVASASSGLPVSYTSAGSCSNSGGTYTMTPKSKTGTICNEDVFQTGNGNYNAAIVVTEQTTVAATTAPTVTFTSSSTSAQYGATFEVTASSTDDTSVPVISTSTGTVCQITGSTTSGTTVTATVQMEAASGVCDLSAAWAVTTVYSGATKSVKVTAKKATPAGTFTGAPSTANDGATFTVTATSTSTATPTITATPATVCSVGSVTSNGAGGYQATVTIKKASGTCTAKAAWAATTDYDAATLTQTTTAE